MAAAIVGGQMGGSVIEGVSNIVSGALNNASNERQNTANIQSNEKIANQTNASNERMNQYGYNFISDTLAKDNLPRSLGFVGQNSADKMVPRVNQFRGGENVIRSQAPYSFSNNTPMIGPWATQLGVGRTKESSGPINQSTSFNSQNPWKPPANPNPANRLAGNVRAERTTLGRGMAPRTGQFETPDVRMGGLL